MKQIPQDQVHNDRFFDERRSDHQQLLRVYKRIDFQLLKKPLTGGLYLQAIKVKRKQKNLLFKSNHTSKSTHLHPHTHTKKQV